MRRFVFSGLRARLMMFVLLAAIPALGLLLYANLEQREQAAAHIREDALLLTRFTAANQQQFFEGARQLLIALAHLPEVRSRDAAACSAQLADLWKHYRSYTNLNVWEPNGKQFCGAIPRLQPMNSADSAWFRRVVKSHGFTIGNYEVERVTGNEVLVTAYPVLDKMGRLTAVVSAPIDIAWLNVSTSGFYIPEGSVFTTFDHKGTIITHFPNREKWAGKTIPEAPIIKAILARGEGVAEVPGIDGILRLYAFTQVRIAPEALIYVSIGIPLSIAYAEANHALERNLAGMGLGTILLLAAIWFGSEAFVLRRVNALVRAARRLGAGDLSARTGLPYNRGEVSELARVFDKMAESLEEREAERKQAEEALRQSEARYRSLFENMLDGFAYCRMIFEDGRPQDFLYLSINNAFEELTGLKNVIGKKVTEVISGIRESNPELFEIYGRVVSTGKSERFETYLEPLQVWLSISVCSAEAMHFVAIFENITERKRMEAEIHTLATTDVLTGLYNRRGFLALAEQQMKVSERTKKGLTLIFADLDRLKEINDTWGHLEGDKALCETAKIFKEIFRGADIIARIGGDEFAILAMKTSEAYPSILIDRLRHEIDRHNLQEGRLYDLSMSIGLAEYDPDHPCSLDDMMSHADIRMYDQKKKKSGNALASKH